MLISKPGRNPGEQDWAIFQAMLREGKASGLLRPTHTSLHWRSSTIALYKAQTWILHDSKA